MQFRHQSKKTRERERQYEARQIASEIFGKRKGEIEREREKPDSKIRTIRLESKEGYGRNPLPAISDCFL